jgi:hypothetical protein
MFVDFLIIRMAKLSNNIVTAQAIAHFLAFLPLCNALIKEMVLE